MRCFWMAAAAALSLCAADRTITSESTPGAIYFSADGKSISGRCRDNHIRTWDVASGALLADKAVAARTTMLAANLYAELDAEAGRMRVWDLTAQRQLQLINGAPRGLTTVRH